MFNLVCLSFDLPLHFLFSHFCSFKGIYDKFVERFTELAKTFTVGDPCDPNTKMGALVSEQHLEKV